MAPFIKTICVDFDGVLHRYDTKWSGAATISDGPVAGAMAFLKLVAESPSHHAAVYSSRSKEPAGVEAMRRWIREHLEAAFGEEEADGILGELSFPIEKPAAWLTIDDRAIRFEGTFPTLEEIDAFVPWNKRTPTERREAEVEARSEKLWAQMKQLKSAGFDRLVNAFVDLAMETGIGRDDDVLKHVERLARLGHRVETTTSATITAADVAGAEWTQEPTGVLPIAITDATVLEPSGKIPGWVDRLYVSTDVMAGDRDPSGKPPRMEIVLHDFGKPPAADAPVVDPGAAGDTSPRHLLTDARLRALLEVAWCMGASSAYDRRARPAFYFAQGWSAGRIRGLDVSNALASTDRVDEVLADLSAQVEEMSAGSGPVRLQPGHEEGDPAKLRERILQRLTETEAQRWIAAETLVLATCREAGIVPRRIWRAKGGWGIGNETITGLEALELTPSGLKAKVVGMIRRAA